MPYVHIQVTEEGVTPLQKQQLVQGVTALLQQVLGKKPASTQVVIDEVETGHWGTAGEPVSERRRRGL